jgi:hypothetical protein
LRRKYSEGFSVEVGGLVPARPLDVLVEAVQQPRRPRAVALQQRDAQVREALQDAAGAQADGHELDGERLVERVPHHQPVEHFEREVGLR